MEIGLAMIRKYSALSLMLMSGFAHSQIRLAAGIQPGQLEANDNSLPYNQVLEQLTVPLNVDVDILFRPHARAEKLFDQHDADCLFPANINFIDEEPKPIASNAINYAKAYFFSLEPYTRSIILNDPALRIGFHRGFSYGQSLKHVASHKLVEVNTDKQNVGLLLKGRIESFIAYVPDINELLEKHKKHLFYYDLDKPVYVQEETIVCHSNPKNASFLKLVNHELEKLRNNGLLKRLLKDNYVAP